MKDLKVIVLIIVVLAGGSIHRLLAHDRQARTPSAKAAYGVKTEPSKKIKKRKKEHKHRQAKAIRERELANRKRNNWAG